MSKKILTMLCCGVLAVTVTGCSSSKSSKSSVIVQMANDTAPEKQFSENCEDAYRELFSAVYTENCGSIFYGYAYPEAALDAMRKLGTYETRITTYNKSQAPFVQSIKHKPEVKSIDSNTAMSEAQLECAARYFAQLAREVLPKAQASDFKVLEGYEIRSTVIDYNEKEGNDVMCVIRLEGEGWKVFTGSIATLETQYPETDSE